MSQDLTFTPITECRSCKHYREELIFEVCAHEKSQYRVGERVDMHTCSHMRRAYGACGSNASLREVA